MTEPNTITDSAPSTDSLQGWWVIAMEACSDCGEQVPTWQGEVVATPPGHAVVELHSWLTGHQLWEHHLMPVDQLTAPNAWLYASARDLALDYEQRLDPRADRHYERCQEGAS